MEQQWHEQRELAQLQKFLAKAASTLHLNPSVCGCVHICEKHHDTLGLQKEGIKIFGEKSWLGEVCQKVEDEEL